MGDLFATRYQRELFLNQLFEIRQRFERDLNGSDGRTEADQSMLQRKIEVLGEILSELRVAWAQADDEVAALPQATHDEIMARVDDALAGWYAAYYDPRVVAPAIAELVLLAERIVRESGRSDGFDAAAWVEDWIHNPHPALGGRCPVELLSTADGVQLVRDILSRQQSGAYS